MPVSIVRSWRRLSWLLDRARGRPCKALLRGLRQLVAETENGEQPRYDVPSTNVTHCTINTLLHFPGVLGLIQAVPFLRVLEERLVGSGQCYSSFVYDPHEPRQLAQISLRRLGEKYKSGYGESSVLEAIVAKQRTGPTGKITFTFLKEYGRIESFAVGIPFEG